MRDFLVEWFIMGILNDVANGKDIKQLNNLQLQTLAEEVRCEILEVTKNNGGHLSANLGIVDTTVSLHYNFDFPKDKIIFDVGHQCYTHKILSGRRDEFKDIRKKGGISGFPEREESPFDCFNTGHAGTSISAALGICEARDLSGEDYCVIAVVGDGALTNGLNLEAVNASNTKPKKLIVVLNDNGMSISKNVNGFYKFISKKTTKKGYVKRKRAIKKAFGSSFITKFLTKIRDFLKRIFNINNYFEKYGFKYVGVINGNDICELNKTFALVKEYCKEKAVFLHIKTTKGKGFEKAEENSDTYHGVNKNFENGNQSFSDTLGEKLVSVMEKNKKVVALTAGMKDGTGLAVVEKKFPDRFYDVGIAEEYAVTLAAGMASGGIKPVFAVYSTFLQRAYDQILHDVCLQNLPVVFCIDRAGLSGGDGKTHQGVFDLSYLSHIPNITLLAPITENELKQALDYALSLNSPVAIRYPKSSQKNDFNLTGFNNGKSEIVKSGKDIAVLCIGPRMLNLGLEFANESLKDICVVAVKCVKPLDTELLSKIEAETVFVLEEGSIFGGFGQTVSAYYSEKGINKRVVKFGVPDRFISHAKIEEQLEDCGITLQALKDKSNGL